MRFAHLHGHSTYSFLDGYGTPQQIVNRTIELGHTSMCMTDHGNIYGHVPFNKLMLKAGLKPIFGCEFYVVDDATKREKYNTLLGVEGFPHVTIIAKTQKGYENLLSLVSIASSEGFYYKARTDWQTIAKYQEGIIVLSGCVGGYPSRLILNKDRGIEPAWQFCSERKQQIENFYIEFVPEPDMKDRNTGEDISNVIVKLNSIAKDLNIPTVMTADAHFPRPQDHIYEDIMVCISMNKRLDDKTRYIKLPEYQYYCTAEELMVRATDCFIPKDYKGGDINGYTQHDYDIICDFAKAIERSADIADSIEVEIPQAKSVSFYGRREDEDAAKLLWTWVEDGFVKRIKQGLIPDTLLQVYCDRAQHEFDIIAGKGFSDYLLTITDISKWAKAQNTLVMCRGSAGGCLLLWLLGCSETDSIRHELSFERFYDETRMDPPDVDMDFETWFRPKVIEYIYSKYGRDKCSQVAVLTLLRAKNSVQDVANVFGIPESEYKSLSAELDSKDDDIDKQIDELTDPTALAVLEKYPMLKLASGLVGQARQQGVNAAGFIISSEPLNKAIATISNGSDVQVSSIDKHGAADIGLLKLDLLGVAAYDVLGHAIRKLGLHFEDLYSMPLGDNRDIKLLDQKCDIKDIPWSKAYGLIRQRNVAGVFQIDGSVMRVAEKAGLEQFEELYAASALCRPGAMDHVPEYSKNKHNANAFNMYLENMHPIARQIVTSTYGILVYQEQVMAICRLMGKMPWPQIHKLRKRIASASFHGFELGPEYSDDFFNGCKETGVSDTEAKFWWDAIKAHGIYCISGDTIIDSGSKGISGGGPITIKEYYEKTIEQQPYIRKDRNNNIYYRYTGFASKFRAGLCHLLQMDIDGRIRPAPVLDVKYNGKQITYEIKTSNKKSIRITANHKMLTKRGYIRCDELTTNDYLIGMNEYEKTTITSQSKWGQTSDNLRQQVVERSNGKCERCDNDCSTRFEVAHILSFDDCQGVFELYHHINNLEYLCNSCHKQLDYDKGERHTRWSKGRSTYETKIVSIEKYGEEDTYCIVMGTETHNFIANGFVSHNSFNKSHCVTYGIVGYWMLWLKANYPEAYYESYLNVEGSSSTPNPVLMKRLVQEYVSTGGKVEIISPLLSIESFSSPFEGYIVGGWGNIKGIGEKTAKKIVENGPYEEWQHILDAKAITVAMFNKFKKSGLTDNPDVFVNKSDNIDVQSIISLAPWLPVPKTGEFENNCRIKYNLHRPGELAEVKQSINGDIYVGGYLTAKHKRGRTGTFRGEQIDYILEDETGIIMMRVSRKLSTSIGQRLKKCTEGDYLACCGWWTGETLFVKDFGILKGQK